MPASVVWHRARGEDERGRRVSFRGRDVGRIGGEGSSRNGRRGRLALPKLRARLLMPEAIVCALPLAKTRCLEEEQMKHRWKIDLERLRRLLEHGIV